MNRKAVMVIANNGFRDEEFQIPKFILEENGLEVTVASSNLSLAKGVLGAQVMPDILVDDVNPEDYDAVIFVGGAGSREYWDNDAAHKIINAANNSKKIIGAICIAPMILANAGVLEGKKATIWHTEAPMFKSKGVSCTVNPLERDGNIITPNGPNSASKFAESLVEAIK